MNKRTGKARFLLKPAALSIAVLLGLYVFSGLRTINPDEQALVLRFGRKLDMPLLPGTHFTFPWPVDKVFLYKPNEVKTVLIGASRFRPLPEGVHPASVKGANVGSEFLAGDENIIEMEVNVQYKINEPHEYLFRAIDVDRLVVLACENALTEAMARTKVDDMLTTGRQIVLTEVKDTAQKILKDMRAGVAIITTNLSKASPPLPVADAFRDVASALEDKDRLINEANGQYAQAIPEARGEAIRIEQEAMADKNGVVKRAQGETERFMRTLNELNQSPHAELSILRLYLESMETVLPQLKKYVMHMPEADSGNSQVQQFHQLKADILNVDAPVE